MLRSRVLLCFSSLLLSASGYSNTEAPAWNCEKGLGDKEWSCTSSSTPAAQAPAIETPAGAAPGKEPAAATDTAPKVARQPLAPLPSVAIKPPTMEKKSEGWTCNSNSENATWDCNLVGNDPKGQPKLVGEEIHHLGFLEPAFNLEQEQIFTRLKDTFPSDPWQYCTTPWAERPEQASQVGLREQSPLNVRADYGETFDQEISNFLGNVDITRGDQHLQADTANYDSVSQVMDAQGHIMYSEEQLALFSHSAQIRLGTDKTYLRDALFVVPSVPLRGTAKNVYRESKKFSRYEDVSYTSCQPGNQDWIVHGSHLKMNKSTGKASIKNAWLEVKGLPVMYLPYLSFPVDDRRLTGFLSPSYGSTKKNGLDINVPFYWNIAPNYDALVWARYLENRGPLFGGKFRYLTHMTRGLIAGEILPYDNNADKTRWQGSFINNTRFSENWSSSTELNQVSDNKYYEDLSSPLRITTSSFVHSYTDLTYSTPGIGLNSIWDYYQNIDPAQPSTSSPYRRLPQVVLNLSKPMTFMPMVIGMNNEFTYFQHPDRYDIGGRINLNPFMTFPFESPGSFIIPKVSVQNTQYFLDNRLPGLPDSINRTVPVASIDSGLIMEREIGSSRSPYVQTLEPRLFYLYIPYVNQDDIPVYDSALYDTNFNQLFFENRFAGIDRMGDANQVSVALTSRLLQGRTGTELLNLSIGEIFYFQDRRVGTPVINTQTGVITPGPVETSSFSNIITQLSGQVTDHLSFLTGLQWNPNENNVDRGSAALRYRDESNTVFNAGYRYRRDVQNPDTELIHLTDFSFHLPLFNDWSVIGRWQYSLLDKETLEAFAGLEKESCCWRFRVVGRRYLNSINTEAQNALWVQLELKGLTSFGQDLNDFLERSILGYRKPNR